LNEDETFIDIYGKELGETSKRIKKLDVVTIKKKMR
jgi:hypothetical protein